MHASSFLVPIFPLALGCSGSYYPLAGFIHRFCDGQNTLCGKVVSSVFQHLLIPSIQHPCDQCPKTFGRKGDLTRHKYLHMEVR